MGNINTIFNYYLWNIQFQYLKLNYNIIVRVGILLVIKIQKNLLW